MSKDSSENYSAASRNPQVVADLQARLAQARTEFDPLRTKRSNIMSMPGGVGQAAIQLAGSLNRQLVFRCSPRPLRRSPSPSLFVRSLVSQAPLGAVCLVLLMWCIAAKFRGVYRVEPKRRFRRKLNRDYSPISPLSRIFLKEGPQPSIKKRLSRLGVSSASTGRSSLDRS